MAFSIYGVLKISCYQYFSFSKYHVVNISRSQNTMLSIYHVLKISCSQYITFSKYHVVNISRSQNVNISRSQYIMFLKYVVNISHSQNIMFSMHHVLFGHLPTVDFIRRFSLSLRTKIKSLVLFVLLNRYTAVHYYLRKHLQHTGL